MSAPAPPGFVITQPLTQRAFAGHWHGAPAICKFARDALARARLRREAEVLQSLAGCHAPQLLHSAPDVLILSEAPCRGPAPSHTEVTAALSAVHARGWIHGDLKPAHVLPGPTFIDWEHALPIGTSLADSQQRPFCPGYTHPDVIWGHGTARPAHDFWSLARFPAETLASADAPSP